MLREEFENVAADEIERAAGCETQDVDYANGIELDCEVGVADDEVLAIVSRDKTGRWDVGNR